DRSDLLPDWTLRISPYYHENDHVKSVGDTGGLPEAGRASQTAAPPRAGPIHAFRLYQCDTR
ncbi:hypothetical protein J6590_090279, partial [Homalodisca vitripennis]